MSDELSSAVVSEVVSRAISFLTGKCNEYKGIDERIARLEMLRIKIKSAVEVSEAFGINIEPLHEWQEKLKEALCEAEETLHDFRKDGISLQEKIICTVECRSPSCDQSMQREEHDDGESLVYLTPNLGEPTNCQADMEAKLRLATTLKHLFCRVLGLMNHTTDSPWPAILERLSAFARVLDPRTFNSLNPLMMVDKYLENDEKVNKLIKTTEKLEKIAGDIGDFIELLKLQSKRNMSRKRRRNARHHPHQGLLLVVSLRLPAHGFLFHGEDRCLRDINLSVVAALYLLEFITCHFIGFMLSTSFQSFSIFCDLKIV
jgi:hypothetical protein